MNQTKMKPRLSRETWLQQALDTLAEDPTHLRIDELAERLGVSKGSFYWHFKNRSDFVQAMAEFWRDAYTVPVRDQIIESNESAEDRLRGVMEHILKHKDALYDLAVRAWARHEPSIRDVIREVDKMRLDTLYSIFRDLGLDEAEARMRTRLFVVCHSLEDSLSVQLSRKEIERQLELRHAFFTRR
jgi:AcrR family transcriptional regulator